MPSAQWTFCYKWHHLHHRWSPVQGQHTYQPNTKHECLWPISQILFLLLAATNVQKMVRRGARSTALYSMKQWSVGWKSVPGGRARALLGSWRWSWRKKHGRCRPLQKQNELVVITQPIWKSISQINSPGRGEKIFLKIELPPSLSKKIGPLRAERCGNSPQLLHGIDPQLKVIVPGRLSSEISVRFGDFTSLTCLSVHLSCLCQLNLLSQRKTLPTSVFRRLCMTHLVLTDTAGISRNHEN